MTGGRIYKDAVTIGSTTIYSGTGDPNGVLSATEGSLFLDDDGGGDVWRNTDGATTWEVLGGGGGGSARATFTLLEAGPADPTNGVYMTWAAVHAAAATVEGLKQIYIIPANPAVAVPVGPAAAYDMTGITLVGQEEIVDNIRISVADGVTFTGDWTGETPYIDLNYLGTATPLFTVDTGGAGVAYLMKSGYRASWRSNGTIEIVRVTNNSVLHLYCDPHSTFVGSIEGGGTYEAFNMDGALCSVAFFTSESVTIEQNTVRGTGAAEVFISGGDTYAGLGGGINTNQANLAGGTFLQVTGNQTYDTAVPANWDPPPVDVREAIDRIASYVQAMDAALAAAAVAGFPLGPIT